MHCPEEIFERKWLGERVLRPEVLRDPNHAVLIQERFRREAQTLASMKSRHTIALYDYGVTDEGNWEGTNILVRPVRGDLIRPPEID